MDKKLNSVTAVPESGVIKYYITHKIFRPKKSMYEIQKLLGFFSPNTLHLIRALCITAGF